ncbi:hypothetical protein RSSM_06521 [Rhodopirellula sallentina SM41]|uniref:Uncharacterized protein n=1 Tax=Rhodopirellula sallentina SM41 TaxID=1263870 RepID=M5U7V3_9BACT|nr:hypothetical protein RSSM_06521 [Rhodopirellula sallentina SM41]
MGIAVAAARSTGYDYSNATFATDYSGDTSTPRSFIVFLDR